MLDLLASLQGYDKDKNWIAYLVFKSHVISISSNKHISSLLSAVTTLDIYIKQNMHACLW